jgi:hypothetical protein
MHTLCGLRHFVLLLDVVTVRRRRTELDSGISSVPLLRPTADRIDEYDEGRSRLGNLLEGIGFDFDSHGQLRIGKSSRYPITNWQSPGQEVVVVNTDSA